MEHSSSIVHLIFPLLRTRLIKVIMYQAVAFPDGYFSFTSPQVFTQSSFQFLLSWGGRATTTTTTTTGTLVQAYTFRK